MKHTYLIGDQNYTFETVEKKKKFICTCLEMPQCKAEAATSRKAIEACVNLAHQMLGQGNVKIRRTRRVRRVLKSEKKKPWWQFW